MTHLLLEPLNNNCAFYSVKVVRNIHSFHVLQGYLMNRQIMEVEIRSQIVMLSRERIYDHILVHISCPSYAMLVSGVRVLIFALVLSVNSLSMWIHQPFPYSMSRLVHFQR